MTLLKPLNNTTMLIPYEQFFIQSFHQEGQLIPEQYPGKQKLLLQLAADPSYTHGENPVKQHPSHWTQSLHCRTPDLQPTTTLGMFFLIHLIYILEPLCFST